MMNETSNRLTKTASASALACLITPTVSPSAPAFIFKNGSFVHHGVLHFYFFEY